MMKFLCRFELAAAYGIAKRTGKCLAILSTFGDADHLHRAEPIDLSMMLSNKN